ncbi:hypothetical protein [Flagellimonas sp.]|uniref:hypothetical protein n=1 Tax=Flagellimonas sp. TaxID=2058762 RepID=UPI003B5AB0B7
MKSPVHFFMDTLPKKLRRITSVLLAAFMLGISNVFLEEDRMINDTRAKIEHQEIQDEDEEH